MDDEQEPTLEEAEHTDFDDSAPVRVAPDQLEPDTLRAVVESFVLREGTDYGLNETSLEVKVAQVLRQVYRGEAHITFDPGTASVNLVVMPARHGLTRRGD
ncbi:MAG TPA: YheU family protein [Luteitalea sp.]|nr:YheU family protein [Luteitalea sp.]